MIKNVTAIYSKLYTVYNTILIKTLTDPSTQVPKPYKPNNSTSQKKTYNPKYKYKGSAKKTNYFKQSSNGHFRADNLNPEGKVLWTFPTSNLGSLWTTRRPNWSLHRCTKLHYHFLTQLPMKWGREGIRIHYWLAVSSLVEMNELVLLFILMGRIDAV